MIVICHWGAIASFENWWTGHCYGPRYWLDVLPYIFILLALALEYYLKRGKLNLFCKIFLAILILFSIFVHYRGATSTKVRIWNIHPINIDQDPWRVWDISDAQFLRGL